MIDIFDKDNGFTLNKWQEITDLLAKLINVTSAIIVKSEGETIKVVASSNSNGNPYKIGDVINVSGTFTEITIEQRSQLLVADAKSNTKWDNNYDVNLGMISYLGSPVSYPDGTNFGAICVLDNKANNFGDIFKNLIENYKDILEGDIERALSLHTIVESDKIACYNRFEFFPRATFIWEKSGDDYILADANKKAFDGFGRETILGIKLSEFWKNVLGLEEGFLSSVHSESTITIERKIKNSQTGDDYFISITFNSFPPNQLQLIIEDITKNKTAENELAKLKAAAEQSANTIIITDIDGNIEYVNPKFTEITGYLAEEVLGKNTRILKSGMHEQDLYVNMWNVLLSGNTWEGDIYNKAKDGSYYWEHANITPIKDSVGNTVNYMAVMQDITKLRESETRLKTFINAVPDIICYKNGKGEWLLANDADLELFCLTGVDYFGKTDAQLAPFTNEIYKEAFNACMVSDEEAWKNKKVVHGIEVIPHIDGKERIYDVFKIPTFHFNGERKALAVIGRDITVIKETEQILKNSEAKYKSLAENAVLGIGIHDLQGNLKYVNKRAAELLKYDIDELQGVNISKIVDPSFAAEVKDTVEVIINIGEYKINEQVFLQKDGTPIYVEAYGNRIMYENEVAIQVTFNDITKRKKAEQDALLSSMHYKQLFNILPYGAEVLNLDGYIVDCSTMNTKIFGYETDELIGKHMTDVVSMGTKEIYKKNFSIIKKGQKISVEAQFIHKDGSIIDVLRICQPIVDTNNNITNVLCLSIDITKLKNTERKLIEAKEIAEENEARIKSIINQSAEGVTVADMDGKYILVNPAFCAMSGYSEEELLKLTVFDMKAKGQTHNSFHDSIGKNEGVPIRATLRKKDGTNYYTEIVGSVINLDKKQVALGTIRDITNQINIESELVKARDRAEESDRLKSSFLANMSHEIRTPMNGILGFTSLLNDPNLTGDDRQNYISIIEKSGQRMLNTVSDIIDISKIETGQMTVVKSMFDYHDLFVDMFKFFEKECSAKGLQLSTSNDINSEELIVYSDKGKLESVFTNLIKNAIKYTDKGGIEMGYTKNGDYINFYIEDTGIGIPDERQDAVFNRFEQADIKDTRAFEGSGLGLAIVKSYVTMLGGKVWLESQIGVGSTFYFSIPVNDMDSLFFDTNEEKSAKETEAKDVNVNKKLRILIAEDDDASYLYLHAIFKTANVELIRSITGADAVEKCKKNTNLDLILMDIRLPEMSGYEATKEIRKFNKDIIIIAQTAHALLGDRQKAIDSGCNDYISKPVDAELLFDKISKLVGFKLK